jgi:hypothetical protein
MKEDAFDRARAVLHNTKGAVEAMKDGRTQDYDLRAEGVIALWDALATLVQTERSYSLLLLLAGFVFGVLFVVAAWTVYP